MAGYLIDLFGSSLALTVAIELAVAVLWGVRPLRGLVLVALVNLLTNPLVVLFWWLSGIYLPALPAIAVQLVLEAAATAAEAGIYCSFAGEPQWRIRHPVLLSVTANLCAWLFGLARGRL
ncbi:MAG: hypothetical protein NC337_12960 [Roseburia sp.]|nr:hypothetical protein [Roseburia sp.]